MTIAVKESKDHTQLALVNSSHGISLLCQKATLPVLNILKEAKIPKAQFTTITLRRKVTFTQQDVQLRLGITEASNELSDEDQECHDKLFSCPEDGCIKSFQRFSSLQHHLDVGRHSYALENEMLFDKAITSFATKLEQGTATVENPVEDIEACQALKSMSIQRT